LSSTGKYREAGPSDQAAFSLVRFFGQAKKMTPCKKENETGVKPRFFNDLIERYYVKSQIHGCWSV
jgi:hypothetical protein